MEQVSINGNGDGNDSNDGEDVPKAYTPLEQRAQAFRERLREKSRLEKELREAKEAEMMRDNSHRAEASAEEGIIMDKIHETREETRLER